jgi:hypothetical protein
MPATGRARRRRPAPRRAQVFQSDSSAPAAKSGGVPAALREAGFKTPAAKEAPKPKAAAKPKTPEVSVQGGDLDPRAVALPGEWPRGRPQRAAAERRAPRWALGASPGARCRPGQQQQQRSEQGDHGSAGPPASVCSSRVRQRAP